jgi:HAD superfamily hydrolase (TIGR01509 family)
MSDSVDVYMDLSDADVALSRCCTRRDAALIGRRKLILFDMDGVLVDSADVMKMAWEEVRVRAGVMTPFDDYQRELGRPFDHIISRLGHCAQLADIKRVYESVSKHEVMSVMPYPGMIEILKDIIQNGGRVGVVTSKSKSLTSDILRRFDVDFAAVMTADDGPGKPSPSLLLAALAEADARADEALYVGDMYVDYQAASAARVAFVHAAWGYGLVPPGVTSIEKPAELLAYAMDESWRPSSGTVYNPQEDSGE